MNSSRTQSSSRGFTLVELLVSIGIFTLITTTSVFGYSDFNSSVLLTNLAYDVALSVRQAQFYGITVKQSSDPLVNFDSGYGVHFTRDATSYTLFEDGRGGGTLNHQYETALDPADDEAIETYSIQKGNFISRLCAKGSGSINCGLTSLDLSFMRPNPETYVALSENANPSVFDPAQTLSIICVASPKGTVRKVTVESTGQISVSTDAPECSN
jgi:prepilin-type N-terminal cleavage/methylation domain-containing protein